MVRTRFPAQPRRALAGVFMAGLLAASVTQAAAIKDAESASHDDSAATYQVVDTYSYPGFQVVQFNLAVLSHYSYLLVSKGEALVVDPGRDVQAYLDAAKVAGAVIKGVLLTHSHADFVAGHTELAKAVGCPVYVNAATQAGYPHQPLTEESTLAIGAAQLRFLATPGHTPDGLCALVYGSPRQARPEVLFTGDTLFVGSVGRPDLMGGTTSAAALASMLFDTWTQKLAKLDDAVVVFPAHGAGSLCGAHLSDKPFSTIGAERTGNAYLQQVAAGRSAFIAAVLDGLPEAPQYFRHNAKLNHDGPPLVNWVAPLPAETVAEARLADGQLWVVDVRSAADYAAGHIPKSLNIGVRGRLETWVGIMVPWGAPLVLTGSRADVEEARRRLHRVGYDQPGYVLSESWTAAKLPVARTPGVPPPELHAQMQAGTAPVIVDVRLPAEWMGLRIGSVVNLPLNHLGELAAAKLDPAQPVVTVCNSAYRSSMAVGVLERVGFQRVRSLEGGSEAWLAAGLPVFGAEAAAGGAPAQGPRRVVPLADRIGPAELKRLLLDLPESFELVDIRPAAAFADYSLPGARNVDIGDLINHPAYLTGAGPLIIVDRDGSLAMMAAGILAQKTQRPIKALFGGLEAYWREADFPGPGGAGPAPRAPVTAPAPVTRPAPPPAPAAPAPAAPPAKRSAGC